LREWKHEDNLFLWSVEAIASRRKPRPTKHWNILKYKFENDEKIYINGKLQSQTGRKNITIGLVRLKNRRCR
jgi:hypothetical protein